MTLTPDAREPMQNQQVKVEKNPFLLSLDEKCVESKLYELLGITPKYYYTLKDRGVIPQKGSYRDFLLPLFAYYKDKSEAAAIKASAAVAAQSEGGGKRNYRSADTESGLPKVVEAEKIQNIRLGKAREEQVHIANLKERGNILDKAELYTMVAPIITNIASVLRNAGDLEPKLQPTIDSCFLSLYNLAERLLAQTGQDSERYVKEMLAREIDLDELVAEMELDV